jgi:hypothetical protein
MSIANILGHRLVPVMSILANNREHQQLQQHRRTMVWSAQMTKLEIVQLIALVHGTIGLPVTKILANKYELQQ